MGWGLKGGKGGRGIVTGDGLVKGGGGFQWVIFWKENKRPRKEGRRVLLWPCEARAKDATAVVGTRKV